MKIYISPSDQSSNVGVGDYGNEADRMQALSDLLVPILKKSHTVYGGSNSISLDSRIKASNDNNVDIHVALHSNAGGGTGPETWYYTDSANGKKLAKAIQAKLEDLKGDGRGIKASKEYKELNSTNAVAALVEVAFHDNQDDVTWMLNNWKKIAQAIADGINAY